MSPATKAQVKQNTTGSGGNHASRALLTYRGLSPAFSQSCFSLPNNASTHHECWARTKHSTVENEGFSNTTAFCTTASIAFHENIVTIAALPGILLQCFVYKPGLFVTLAASGNSQLFNARAQHTLKLVDPHSVSCQLAGRTTSLDLNPTSHLLFSMFSGACLLRGYPRTCDSHQKFTRARAGRSEAADQLSLEDSRRIH